MKLKAFDAFELEGNEQELALYTFILMEMINRQAQKDKEDEMKKEMELYNELANMTIEELMKREREDEKDD